MHHGEETESLGSYNIFGRKLTLPFDRVLRQNGKVLYITIPQGYRKSFRLKKGQKVQFYIEVSS